MDKIFGWLSKFPLRRLWGSLAIIAALIWIPIITVQIGNSPTPGGYDVQAFLLFIFRMLVLIVVVLGAFHVFDFFQDDDRAEDYQRINQNPIAVAIYRGAEYLGVLLAAAVLLSKV